MDIDLATFKKRSEFIEAYEAVEQERDYWREFAHDLEVKLQQHEGVAPTEEEAEKEFQKFWTAYGKKGNLKQTRRRWHNLSRTKKALAMDKVVAYVKSTPEKCYRKGGEVWLNNECWNDEIVEAAQPYGRPTPVRAQTSPTESKVEEDARLARHSELRQASRGRNIKDILK